MLKFAVRHLRNLVVPEPPAPAAEEISQSTDTRPHQVLGLGVKYFGDTYPDKFHFLNPADFLANGAQFESFGVDDMSWYLTELDNGERYRFIVKTMGYLCACRNTPGNDYYEFGCFGANTFRMVLSEARKHGLDAMNFFAFDSFEGLPTTDSQGHGLGWDGGDMAMSEEQFMSLVKAMDVYSEKVRTYKGFYSDSLTAELQAELVEGGHTASFVNVDCDLKISAESVFPFIEPLLKSGTVLYLDEYFLTDTHDLAGGVYGAFEEYQKVSRFEFVPFLDVGWWGKAFICKKRARSVDHPT